MCGQPLNASHIYTSRNFNTIYTNIMHKKLSEPKNSKKPSQINHIKLFILALIMPYYAHIIFAHIMPVPVR
jgi:hypothetical protein